MKKTNQDSISLEIKENVILEDGKKKAKSKKKNQKGKRVKPDKEPVIPYREIVLSDGHGFYIKTVCNLTSDDQVQVMQYREHIDPEGSKFACTEPIYFENKQAFLEWLIEVLKKNFDEIPYITITPIEISKIKKHEREATDSMYL